VILEERGLIPVTPPGTCTGGIERFLAKENFRKILKVSHFYSGFSSNKKP